MIFVILGTQKQQFTRLLELVENCNEFQNDEIIVQSGNTKYQGNKLNVIPFMSDEELKENMKKAELVVCHGGVGTIFNSLELNKKILAVPRLKKYKEHINDHQIEVCQELENLGYILMYKENQDFCELIKRLKTDCLKKYVVNEEYLNILRKEI